MLLGKVNIRPFFSFTSRPNYLERKLSLHLTPELSSTKKALEGVYSNAMADEGRRPKRSRFDQTEPRHADSSELKKSSRFDRRSRSPSTRDSRSGRSRSPLDRDVRSSSSEMKTKSPVDAAAAAGMNSLL